MILFKNKDLSPKEAMRNGRFTIVKTYKMNGVKYYHHKAVAKCKIWIKIDKSNSMCVSIEKGEVIATQENYRELSKLDIWCNWIHKRLARYKVVRYSPKWR